MLGRPAAGSGETVPLSFHPEKTPQHFREHRDYDPAFGVSVVAGLSVLVLAVAMLGVGGDRYARLLHRR